MRRKPDKTAAMLALACASAQSMRDAARRLDEAADKTIAAATELLDEAEGGNGA